MDNNILSITNAIAFVILIVVVGIGATIAMGMAPTTLTSSGELFTGVAATALPTAGSVISVSSFSKAGAISSYNQYNATPLVGGTGAINIVLDSEAAHGGNTWDNLTVDFTLQGLNATNTIRWVTGTCNGANKTWITNTQTYTDISSACLVPGGTLTFNFVNATDGVNIANVTNVSITYNRYVATSAYTLTSGGSLIPTASGNYKTTYVYSAQASEVTAANAAGQTGLLNLAQAMPSIGTILGAVIIIGLLFYVFKMKD